METSTKQNKAIVLLSGGQDSTTCLYWAKKQFSKVYAVGFNYGQRHFQELAQASKIAQEAEVPYKLFDVRDLLASSSLTSSENHNTPSKINAELPASFVAGRNLLFLTIASSYGAEIGVNNLIIGASQTDYSGYPDCRHNTLQALSLTLSLGLGVGDVHIHTPLMYLTKAETWKLAKELGCLEVIINDTLTDYNGSMVKNDWGYGVEDNPASVLRAKGYREAKERGWI